MNHNQYLNRLVFILLLELSISLIGCNKQQEVATQTAQAPAPVPIPQAKIQSAEKKPIVVKGFYIGMPIQSVIPVLASYGYFIANDSTNYNSVRLIHAFINHTGNEITFWGLQDKLVEMNMSSVAVNNLFNVSDLDIKTFTDEFINNYGITEMRPLAGYYGWTYRDGNLGYEINIFTMRGPDKHLTMKQIPKQSDRRFD